MRIIFGLLIGLTMLLVSCGDDAGDLSSEPVSVTRIRAGDLVNGECKFSDDLSGYHVTYSGISDDCAQAVTIGPLSRAELEKMKQDKLSFWESSFPYRQALLGQRIDGECEFESPAVKAFLEFSTTVSTNWENCVMIVDVGPATEQQVEEVQRQGMSESSTPVFDPGSHAPGQR